MDALHTHTHTYLTTIGVPTKNDNNQPCFFLQLDDPFWRGRRCLSVVRSQSAPALDCRPGIKPIKLLKNILNSLTSTKTFLMRDKIAIAEKLQLFC